jgi:hypothetical protein
MSLKDKSTRTAVAVLERPYRTAIVWRLLVLAMVSVVAVWIGLANNAVLQNYLPESRIFASSFNRRASGVSGLFEIAREVGIKCVPWDQPYRQLPETKGLLVIIEPSTSLAEFEVEQILNWVKQGNDLIYLDNLTYKMTRRLVENLGITVRDGKELTDAALPIKQKSKLFDHIRSLKVSAQTRLSAGTTLLGDDSGTLITKVKHGNGTVYVGTVPNLCSNFRLADKSSWPNFQFMANIFRTTSGTVFFDERCHGFAQATNVFLFLAKQTTGRICGQLLLILTLAVFSSAQRFGQNSKLISRRKISNLEYIRGLARTYRRAHANAAVLEILYYSFRTKIVKALGISPHESSEGIRRKVMDGLSDANRATAIRIGDCIINMEKSLADSVVKDSQLLSLVETCDKLTLRIEELTFERKEKD